MKRLVLLTAAILTLSFQSLPFTATGQGQKNISGVLIECEDFTLGSDWIVQKTKLKGYSGEGFAAEQRPPKIAKTVISKEVLLPKPGKYRVWVRGYLGGRRPHEKYDRRFQTEVNGVLLTTTYVGLTGAKFAWEYAGEVEIGADKKAVIKIHDRGKSWAIADCVLITSDLGFWPEDWTGNSRRIEDMANAIAEKVKLPLPEIELQLLHKRFPRAEKEHVERITTSKHNYQIEMGGTLDGFNTVYYADTYSGCEREAVKFEPNEYLIIENIGESDVVNPRIVVGRQAGLSAVPEQAGSLPNKGRPAYAKQSAAGRRNWYSADDILNEITTPSMSDEEKAMAIYGFTSSIEIQCHDNNLRVGPPYPDDNSNPSRNTFKERANPVKAANCYYCSGCSLSAANFVILCRHAGMEARAVWICPLNRYATHCVAEVRYNGDYHLFDPELRVFYLDSDNTNIASYEKLHKNPGLIARTHHCGFANKERLNWNSGYEKFYPPHVMPVEQWLSKMEMTLRPGESFVWRWDNVNKFRYGDNCRKRPDTAPYRLANGKTIYKPDLANVSYRKGIVAELNVKSIADDGLSPKLHPDMVKPLAHVIYKVRTAYPIVGGIIGGKFHRKNETDLCEMYISIGDSDWIEVWSAEARRGSPDPADVTTVRSPDSGDLSVAGEGMVRRPARTGDFECYVSIDELIDRINAPPRYEYYVKYAFQATKSQTDVGMDEVYIETDVQMANTSLPSLSVGANSVVYHDETKGEHSVKVTHGWKESSATKSPLPPAEPISPKDSETVGMAGLEELIWRPAKDSDGEISDYHIRVSPRPDMLLPLSPNFDRIIFSNEQRWKIPEGWLVSGRKYYWRVRAQDNWGAWSEWSRVWSFGIK